MDHDPWRQWQRFAGLWAAASPDSKAKSWRAGGFGFAPFVDAAEHFTTAAQTFLDGTASRSAPAAEEAARIFSDFLRERFGDFQMPWSSEFGAGAAVGATPPFMGDAPAFGAGREHQERWQRMAEAARRIDEAQRRLQRLWSDALREAAIAFAARLVPPQPSAVSPEAVRTLYDSWIDCAEDAYARTAHGEAFCSALADYVNASSQWRQELQASVEHMAKLLDLPTRSEINTLMRRLKTVEDRLRAVPDEPKPPIAPRRKRSARRRAKR